MMLEPKGPHEEFYRIMSQTLNSEPFKSMPAEELLAVASNFLGKLCALQDQSRYTSAQIMEIVIKNLEIGNQQMLREVQSAGGTPN